MTKLTNFKFKDVKIKEFTIEEIIIGEYKF